MVVRANKNIITCFCILRTEKLKEVHASHDSLLNIILLMTFERVHYEFTNIVASSILKEERSNKLYHTLVPDGLTCSVEMSYCLYMQPTRLWTHNVKATFLNTKHLWQFLMKFDKSSCTIFQWILYFRNGWSSFLQIVETVCLQFIWGKY